MSIGNNRRTYQNQTLKVFDLSLSSESGKFYRVENKLIALMLL